MAASNNDFGAPALEKEETVIAIRLAEALRSDEVEIFLEIYDSIPSNTEITRVSIGLQCFCKSARLLLPCKQRLVKF